MRDEEDTIIFGKRLTLIEEVFRPPPTAASLAHNARGSRVPSYRAAPDPPRARPTVIPSHPQYTRPRPSVR